MFELLYIAQGIFERDLIFGLVVAAVYLSSRLIKFDNLALEGAFGLGGAITAILTTYSYNPLISLAGAIFGGILSGIITGLLNTKLKLNNLIAGIVVTSGLFSIILKIAGSTISLNNKITLFSLFHFPCARLSILLILCCIIFFIIKWFLLTEVGFLLRAVGTSPQMLINVGKSIEWYLVLGITLSNSLAALSGALFVHYTGYFSIWGNVGILIIGLAGMILAQMINKNFGAALLIGSIIYQTIIAMTFELEINQEWNKLISACMIVILIALKQSSLFKTKRISHAKTS